MVEPQPSKLIMPVRSRSAALSDVQRRRVVVEVPPGTAGARPSDGGCAAVSAGGVGPFGSLLNEQIYAVANPQKLARLDKPAEIGG
jgi:hypothetical protein